MLADQEIKLHLDLAVSTLQNEYFNRFDAKSKEVCSGALAEILRTCEAKLSTTKLIKEQ